MASNVLNASVFFALIAYVSACSCILEDLETRYYRNLKNGTPFTRAKVIDRKTKNRTIAPLFPGAEPFTETVFLYLLTVDLVYDECRAGNPNPKVGSCGYNSYFITRAVTPVSSATCGVSLERGVTYLVPLSTDPLSENEVNLCQFITPINNLKPEEKAFLDSRRICRFGYCTCAGSKHVSCPSSPYQNAKPPAGCTDAHKCIENTCGSCKAEFFTKNNLPSCRSSIFAVPKTTPTSEE